MTKPNQHVGIYVHNEDTARLKPLVERLEKKGARVSFYTLKFPEANKKLDQVLTLPGYQKQVKELFKDLNISVHTISDKDVDQAAAEQEAQAPVAAEAPRYRASGARVEDVAKPDEIPGDDQPEAAERPHDEGDVREANHLDDEIEDAKLRAPTAEEDAAPAASVKDGVEPAGVTVTVSHDPKPRETRKSPASK